MIRIFTCIYSKYFVLRVDRSHLAEYRSRYLINAIADKINEVKMWKINLKNLNLQNFLPTWFQKKHLFKKKKKNYIWFHKKKFLLFTRFHTCVKKTLLLNFFFFLFSSECFWKFCWILYLRKVSPEIIFIFTCFHSQLLKMFSPERK